MLASDIRFDASYGIETRTVLEGRQLGVPADDLDGEFAVYHAVNPIVFARSLARVRALAPASVSSGSFVDFGSGKGRALVLAAREGFPRVVGIENSPVLHETCERNLQRVWQRCRFTGRYELHLGDAGAFRVPDDSSVWFWFNPFDAVLARRVATNLLASLKRRPRTAYLIYARPLHLAVLQELGFIAAAEVHTSSTHLDAVVFSPRVT